MTIIHQEKTIERVPIGTLKPTDCFYLSNTEDRVWMYVEHRVNGNAIDANNSGAMYNAVNAETGEIGWIDGFRKVEVIVQ